MPWARGPGLGQLSAVTKNGTVKLQHFKTLFKIKFNQSYGASLCPANNYNVNLDRTKEIINKRVIKLHTIVRKE